MKNKPTMLLRVLATALLATLIVPPASAAPSPQTDDPVAQCAQGVKLFEDDKDAEALPLLEAGFANRNQAIFADPNDLGTCALVLGLSRKAKGDLTGALDAYSVALAVFQSTHNRKREGTTLNNIGRVYDDQGRYAEALNYLRQALVIQRAVGDRAGEGDTLHNIGGVYHDQGRYAEALDYYQQALVIQREGGNRVVEGATLHNMGAAYESQGQYANALDSYQQALVIAREVGDRMVEGATLHNIGRVYDAQGQYAEALATYQQVLAIWQEVGNQVGESNALNTIGEIYRRQGRYADALDVYRQTLVIAREGGDRADEGAILNNIGRVYDDQGQYPEALGYLQQALVILQEVGYRVGEGSTLNNIGLVYEHQGRYAEALNYYQQALVIQWEVGDRAGGGNTLNNIGAIYYHQGQYAKALDYLQKALVIRQEVGDRAGEGATLNNIGEVYRSQGQYAKALDYYQQALVIVREVDNRAGEGSTLNGIGEVYRSQGQYAEALDYLQRALVIVREVGNRAVEGNTLNNIGEVYRSQGRDVEALDFFQQALAITREVGDRAGEGVTLGNIGVIYHRQGRYAEALDSFRQALVIAREVGDRAGEGNTLNNIGGVYDYEGRHAEALDSYQQALVIRREVGDQVGEGATLNNIGGIYHRQGRDAEALDSLQQALVIEREVGDQAVEGTTLSNIGVIYRSQGRYAEALEYYNQAMDIFEAIRAAAGSESGRAMFIAQHAGLYDHAIELYHAQGQDDKAFDISERGRARAFLDSLATGYVELSDDAAADLYVREQEAYAVRQVAQDALVTARAQQPPDEALITDLEKQLQQAETDYQAALKAIEDRGDQLAALVPGRSGVLDLTQVQALLDDHTTLVSYWVLEDQTLAFIITRNSFDTVALDVKQADLEKTISAFRNFASVDEAYPTELQQLYTWLMAPLKDRLTTPVVGIISQGPLHYLPFAALTDGQSYLGDEYVLFSLPSASMLRFLPAKHQGRVNTVLALGNPTLSEPLPNLNYAEQEVEKIASLYGTQPLMDADATESALKAQAATAGIIHLAAHGEYNPTNPLYSTIYLAGDDKNDGRLEVHEIYSLDLTQHTRLVVLSACQTQTGAISNGDEVVGLTRAFLYAGTPTVIASLWNVDDQATALLMERFYTHLQEGQGEAEALRTAQREVRAQYPHPYYWAAFVLTGDPGKISLTASSSALPWQPAWTWAGVGGLLVICCCGLGLLMLGLGGAALWRRRRYAEHSH
jgi:tetratricopeptide (TPR) repeat protein/CHAT domain-containing protein